MTISAIAIGFLWVALALPMGFLVCACSFMIWGAYANTRYTDFSDVKGELERLLHRGYHDGTLKISQRADCGALQFRKYIRAKGDYGIVLLVPRNWRPDQTRKLQTYCAANGLEIAPFTLAGDGPAEQHVDCGLDVDGAHALACAVWTDIFGLAEKARRRFKTQNVVAFDALIDDPDQSDRELEDSQRNKNLLTWTKYKRHDRQSGQPGAGLSTILVITLLTASIGLPLTTLLSLGTPPDWTIALGSSTLSGGTSSVAFLLIYLATLSIWPGIDGTGPARTGRLFKSFLANTVAILAIWIIRALPVVVVLIWLGI